MSTKPGPKMKNPTHEQVLDFVREHSRPFVTTSDVLEKFSTVSRRTINKRLNDLHDRGELQKREIGAQSVVWYTESQH
ncbi:hypothetical protein [Halobellus sp. Atlit-38R]|uniref:hypothetical protein n=1 Tax=Halobellus sp. Atlit-38R TaxID=2282131 RepID=UPI0011C4A87D|nr:hypothetical protein [Halobellus sp. Atlit-38R]